MVSVAENLLIYDIRQPNGNPTYQINFAHEGNIRDIDCNPNKPYRWMTAGDDGYIRFWDLRYGPKKLTEYKAHSHWIWNAKYNPFYDQLCLTCSSDSKVKLWNIYSLSSAEPIHYVNQSYDTNQDQTQNKNILDGLVHTYEDHEESVYSIAWSLSDPWLFASLSYDGRLVIDHIPRQIKYKILL
jgi:WD40 repeat protein